MAQHTANSPKQQSSPSKKKQSQSTNQDHAAETGFIQPVPQELELVEETTLPDILKDPRMQNPNASNLRLQMVNRMQRVGGNAAVQRMIQTQPSPLVTASLIQRQPDEENDAAAIERAKALEFLARGVYGPKTSMGAEGVGGFEATYIAPALLKITVKGGIKFINGLRVEGGTVVAGNAGIQGTADMVKDLPAPDRAAYIAQYTWQNSEKQPFLKKLISVVQQTWNTSATGLSFFINKPEWEWITASIVIDVQLRAIGQDESRAKDDHLIVNAVKEPPGMAETESELRYYNANKYAEDPLSAFDQEIDISSSGVDPREDNNLIQLGTVTFATNSAILSPVAKSRLDGWVATFQGDPSHPASTQCRATIQGYTSASGSTEYNEELAKQRVAVVRSYIVEKGFTNAGARVTEKSFGESEATPGLSEAEAFWDRRVEIIVDTGVGQRVAAHEFGHAFGLGDEYASGEGSLIGSHAGSGRPAGTEAKHHEMTTSMTDESGASLPGAIHENTDSIMSMGNVVRPQHYSTFHNALVKVTGVTEWSIRS